jgi:hypothetical protein
VDSKAHLVQSSVGTMYLLKIKELATNSQQAVARSNNEDMEVDFEHSHGLQGTNENIEGHEAGRNKRGSRGVNEKGRESSYSESKLKK